MFVASLSSAQIQNDVQPETPSAFLAAHHVDLDIDSLKKALESKDSRVRDMAAAQLANIHAIEAIPALVNAMKVEKNVGVKINLSYLVAVLGEGKGVSLLRETCDDSGLSPSYRLLASRYSLDLKDQSCKQAALGMLDSVDSSGTKIELLSLLPRFTGFSSDDLARVLKSLTKLLEDSAPAVRMAAADALASFDFSAATSLLESSISRENDRIIREHLQFALDRLNAIKTRAVPRKEK